MKKLLIFPVACAIMASFTSCQYIKEKLTGDDEDAVYEDEAIEVDEDEVIDPFDDEAYEKYVGKHNNNDGVGERKQTTDKTSKAGSKKADRLMAQFDAKAETMQMLFEQGKKSEATNVALELSMLMNQINDELEEMSQAQINRYQKQVESFSMLMDAYN